MIANQPRFLGGVIDAAASEKAARFVAACDSFGLPLVVLVDTPGFLPGTRQEQAGVIRHGAGLLRAFAAATVPKLTVVLRKAYGGGFITMNSKDLGADLVFAWPEAEIGVVGPMQAVSFVHRDEIARADDPDAERARLAARLRAGARDGWRWRPAAATSTRSWSPARRATGWPGRSTHSEARCELPLLRGNRRLLHRRHRAGRSALPRPRGRPARGLALRQLRRSRRPGGRRSRRPARLRPGAAAAPGVRDLRRQRRGANHAARRGAVRRRLRRDPAPPALGPARGVDRHGHLPGGGVPPASRAHACAHNHGA